jgi:hypothetical protein
MSGEGSQESREGTELVKASAAIFSSGGITSGSIYLPLMVMFPRAVKLWSVLARNMPDKRLNMLNEVRGDRSCALRGTRVVLLLCVVGVILGSNQGCGMWWGWHTVHAPRYVLW